MTCRRSIADLRAIDVIRGATSWPRAALDDRDWIFVAMIAGRKKLLHFSNVVAKW